MATGNQASFLTTKEAFVAQFVREAIVAGRLKPGDRIRQQILANELGMSPTPVREALRALVTEGWLKLVPHVGVSVADVNYDGIDEVYALREMIEGRLAAEAAQLITASQLRELRSINDGYKEASANDDAALTRELNFRFHEAIWEAAGWPTAVGILHSLWVKAPWVAMSGVRGREQRTFKEHQKVIAALKSGDAGRSQEALAAHVRSGRADFHKIAEGRPVEDL
jgi:DNA-binding GntR family transcriptional regulator